MDDTVVCPNCGEANPADLPFCQHCQWRLHPLSPESDSVSHPETPPAPPGPPGSDSAPASVPDWLIHAATTSESDALQGRQSAPSRTGDPARGDDLLAGLALQGEAASEAIPEWVARIMGIAPPEASSERAASDSPTRIPAADQADTSPPSGLANEWAPSVSAGPSEGTPGRQVDAHESIDSISDRPTADDAEINEWLRQLDASAARREIASRPRSNSDTQDVPGWVDQMLGVPTTTPRGSHGQGDVLPDWLIEPARSERTASTPEAARESEPSEVAPDTGVPNPPAPDMASVTAEPPQPTAAAPLDVVPPFPLEEMQRLDVDALFDSMQMPDWLADVGEGQAASQNAGGNRDDAEPIAPANLPSWVQAMRPTTYEPVAGSPGITDARPEARGPLLGLQGVLPAIPGAAAPSARPKSHSIRLETSERQIAHARLLEDLLAAEARPAALGGAPQLKPQNLLRWAIGALMVLLVGGVVLSGSRFIPLPAGVPIESNAAIRAVQNIQPGAPVLAVFDYEPATAGEMEATASALMDHLLLLKHPRLAVISTSSTGSALAERFLSGTLADRRYVRGAQFVNLGFLPGGLTGVRLFAEDPVMAAPLGAASDRVWDSTVLSGTRRLQDFAAVIVITDGLESGRVWIEQTRTARGSARVIVVASAQAGPMLLPYFDSGQIEGLVSGLNGAVGPELSNNGLPGLVGRYWDAYSIGLYAAALLILAAMAWHALMAARERQRENS